MAAMSPEVGDVVRYWYLWRREVEAGEDAGRKPRPCALVVVVKQKAGAIRVALAPITHEQPDATRAAVELPSAVKRQLGLDAARSWVICDEWNEFLWPGFDLERGPDRHPLVGRLPHNLAQRIRKEVLAAAQRGALKRTNRD